MHFLHVFLPASLIDVRRVKELSAYIGEEIEAKILEKSELVNKNIFIKPQKRKIGFVFQDYPLFPHLNLKDNITFI